MSVWVGVLDVGVGFPALGQLAVAAELRAFWEFSFCDRNPGAWRSILFHINADICLHGRGLLDDKLFFCTSF